MKPIGCDIKALRKFEIALTELVTGTRAVLMLPDDMVDIWTEDDDIGILGKDWVGVSLKLLDDMPPNIKDTWFESRSPSSLADESSRLNLLLPMSVQKPLSSNMKLKDLHYKKKLLFYSFLYA